MYGPRAAVAFRHAEYERNRRIDLTGSEAREVADIQLDESYDYIAPLLEKGAEDAEILRDRLRALGFGAVDICVSSPYRRTLQMAEIIYGGTPTEIIVDPNLRERDLGRFKDIPREVFHTDYAESYAHKVEDPLNWRPLEGETLLEASQRAFEVYMREDIAGKLVAFSSHADMIVAKRSLYHLGGLTTSEKLKQPLTPELQNPQWIQNCQADMYVEEDPTWGKVVRDMGYFRSIAVCGVEYDTGWIQIQR